MGVISRAERDRIFGPPGQVDRTVVVTPWGIKVQCHRLIAAVFLQACRDAYTTSGWKPQRIDSYNARNIRGSTKPSMHAYALAWDFFATPPTVVPPGGVWTPDDPVPKEFAACFTRRGFRWGAVFTRVDLPHIEWPGGLPSSTATEATPVPVSHPQEEDMESQFVLGLYAGYFGALPGASKPDGSPQIDPPGFDFWVKAAIDGTPRDQIRASFAKVAGL